MTTPTVSQEWFERAKQVIPGGVNSPVRAFRSVGGTPRFMSSASGAHLTDVDGKRYLDLVGSWGPMILGHAHPEVIEAVRSTAVQGLSFGTPSAGEVELAEEIVSRVAPAQRVRLVSSGTEATMSAIRLARGFTGRSLIVKFAGCYHGHVDALLASAGSGVATFALPDSAGVPEATTREVIVLPYNDISALQATFDQHGPRIAAVITEAAPANIGVLPPDPGFGAAVSALTRQHGALLISDEVMTGFRVSAAGMYGLDGAVEGWAPDLFTFGKVIGGGMPIGAFGGRSEIMDLLAPDGPVYQAGTLSGNPISAAAGLATLRACTPELYSHLDRISAQVQKLVGDALTTAGVPHQVQAVGNLFSVFFATGSVRNQEEAKKQNAAAYAAFFHSLLDSGVYLPPSAFEAWFVSGAHRDEDLEFLESVLPAAAAAAARYF